MNETANGNPPPTQPDAAASDRYRVLIVEDDRSQALFAEAILRGAGMDAEVVSMPELLMETLERFEPELVLMDLHMPGTSGTSLTTQIREHPRFEHIPVVFLTGDQNPDSQLDALEHGGDDYIVKPVRPRHLVVAVQNRIRRARAINHSQQAPAEIDRHPLTGLHTRPTLMKILSQHAVSGSPGGALLIEMGNAAALHDRFGFAEFEDLINSAGRKLRELTKHEAAARLSDNAFFVIANGLDAGGLEEFARRLRDGIGYTDFRVGDTTLRLRCTIGYTSFDHGFKDSADVLAAAEDAAREAHGSPIGIARFVPADRIAANEIAEELRSALAPGSDTLYLAFQPVVAVAGGDEARYQVLARMRGADGSVRKAAEFIDTAQTAGLLSQLDRWVMQHALDLLRERRRTARPVKLIVSQSPRSLAQEGYADWLQQEIVAAGIEGQALIIDVRLEDAMVHAVLLREFCRQMLPSGVQFSLSQYRHNMESSMLLDQLPLGYLRLASDFAQLPLAQTLHDEMRQAIQHAHRQGLQVIAQGVEDPQAAAALWIGGIDFIQGNLVHRPEQTLDFDFRSATL